MRILYLCADRGIRFDKHNGATAHFRSLVRAFRALGHELLVLTPSVEAEAAVDAEVVRIPAPAILEDLLREADEKAPRDQREAQRARTRVVHALGHLWNNVVVENLLVTQIQRFRPDFVFEVYSPFGVAGPLTCNRLRVPHVLNVHAPLAWEGATFRAQALQEAAGMLESTALHHAHRIVANSHEMRNELIQAGIESHKIDVVMNGVDLALFSPDGPVHRSAPEGAVVVGFSGSLKPWHGVDVLCAAFRSAAEDPRLHLVVVGDGPLRTEVHRLSDELPGRVTFTGALPLEEVPAWMRGMDVAVAPYPRLERFYFSPLKILDAMACGIANLASNIGQIPELLTHGETALLVPPGDVDALVAALRNLAADAGLRERLGRGGLTQARMRHAWTSRAQEIVAIATADALVAAR